MKSIKFVPELTEQQIVNLRTLENGDWSGRVRKWAESILPSGRGYSIDEIGAITGFHRNTVSRWLEQWAERGIDGILERHRYLHNSQSIDFATLSLNPSPRWGEGLV